MEPKCLQCEKTADQIPLIGMDYQGDKYYICPQHLPILIHKPANLGDKIPGAVDFGESEGHDH